MASLTCDDNLNPFQPTGFRVIIDRRHYGHVQYFTSKINHPSVQNQSNETAFKRTSVPLPGNTVTYGELQLEVILDQDFLAYSELYNWMLRHVNIEQIQNPFDPVKGTISDEIPTYCDIYVQALTAHNNFNLEFKYIDCIPVSVGDIQFDAQNTAVDPITFSASFRFSYFELITERTDMIQRLPQPPRT